MAIFEDKHGNKTHMAGGTVDTPQETVKDMKFDGGKPDIGMMMRGFVKALESVSILSTKGALKYEEDSWQGVKNGSKRYTAAMMRHWFAHTKGEFIDPEMQVPHLTSVAWNALAVLELALIEQERLTNETK
jgi:hypothetical protein